MDSACLSPRAPWKRRRPDWATWMAFRVSPLTTCARTKVLSADASHASLHAHFLKIATASSANGRASWGFGAASATRARVCSSYASILGLPSFRKIPTACFDASCASWCMSADLYAVLRPCSALAMPRGSSSSSKRACADCAACIAFFTASFQVASLLDLRYSVTKAMYVAASIRFSCSSWKTSSACTAELMAILRLSSPLCTMLISAIDSIIFAAPTASWPTSKISSSSFAILSANLRLSCALKQ
mmetsp:Transcript_89521/g.253694  ORF Transcript_89521/g.253694 Transcript_89521/m.253694 type:complete len:246 (+) Transcript_89521:790-1527(+)